jgi:hypothetical protein
MNKISKYFFVIGLFVAMFFSMCDKVDQPYQYTAPSTTTGGTTDTVYKKIFIEDFTGHTCGNCPKAIDTIKKIMLLYPDRIISVGIHSGGFALTSGSTYSYNFIVPDAATPGFNEIDNFFQISVMGNPNGLINRKEYLSGNHVMGTELWKSTVAQIIADTAKIKITIVNTPDTVAGKITSAIKVKFLYDLTGTYKLATMIIEDSVIKPQKDYRFSPDDILTYAHRHVLRGYLYGAFGEQIGNVDPYANDEVTKTYSGVQIPASVITKKRCAIIAYVYNATTYEIMQVEEAKFFE